MKHLNAILLAAFLPVCASLEAQTVRTDTLSIEISFRQGVSTLDRDYLDNGNVMDGFLSALNYFNSDPSVIIQSVNISTCASPEGDKSNNDKLSRERAHSILRYLSSNTTLSPSQLKVSTRGENWDGLVRILLDCREPWKDEALAIITSSGVLVSDSDEASFSCKQRLKEMEEGTAWRWMEEYAFAPLRSAGGSVMLISSPRELSSGRDTLVIYHEDVIVHRDSVWHCVPGSEGTSFVKEPRPSFRRDSLFRIPVVALRSNLLCPLMNIGVEVPLSNRFSLGADWYYPWAMRSWMNGVFPAQKYCLQGLAASIEARWWFGAKHSVSTGDPRYRLRGHSIGVVATGGYYDGEYDWKGEQGEFIALGVDYMYALPLGKGGVHFEFDLGAGFALNSYRRYNVRYEGGHLIGDGPRATRYSPVPLRARISLVIPITKNGSNEN